MRRIFTFSILGLFVFIKSTNVLAQCPVAANCPPVASETFYTDNGGFTGTAGGFVYNNPDGAGPQGNFRVSQTSAQTAYSVTSGNYSLGSNVTATVVGFTINGASEIASYTITIKDVNSATQTSCTTSGINATTFTVCSQIAVPVALRGKTVQIQISVTTRNSNQGGATGNTTFDDFKTTLPEAIVTPVTFVSFNAAKENTSTKITWKVGVEQNVKGYDIERSTNGRDFNKIGFVAANGQSTYSFIDAQTSQGTVYYRVKNVDNDGNFKYSNILSLRNGVSNLVLKAFPLPALDKITVQHEGVTSNGRINISSSNGSIVRNIKPAAGSIETIINLTGLRSGLYVLSFDKGDGKPQTIKFVKQ
jgi:hypothetical protein